VRKAIATLGAAAHATIIATLTQQLTALQHAHAAELTQQLEELRPRAAADTQAQLAAQRADFEAQRGRMAAELDALRLANAALSTADPRVPPGTFIRQIGTGVRGAGNDQFACSYGVAALPDGMLAVADFAH
jgi:hypothetical protein